MRQFVSKVNGSGVGLRRAGRGVKTITSSMQMLTFQ